MIQLLLRIKMAGTRHSFKHLTVTASFNSFRHVRFRKHCSVRGVINVQLGMQVASGAWVVHVTVCRQTCTVIWTAKQKKKKLSNQSELSIKSCSVNVAILLFISDVWMPVKHSARVIYCLFIVVYFLLLSSARSRAPEDTILPSWMSHASVLCSLKGSCVNRKAVALLIRL